MTNRHSALVALLILLAAVVPTGTATAEEGSEFGCEQRDCSSLLPTAERFERPNEDRYWTAYAADKVVGWVAVSTDIVDIKGYSGKPLVTRIGLDTNGTLTGVEVVKHSEPILLVGIPESKLTEFTNKYKGLAATAKVSVGGSSTDDDAFAIDIISGATVTVLAEDRTIMETARQLGMATGVVDVQKAVPGHFVDNDEVLTWQQLQKKKVFGRLIVSQKEVGSDAYGHGTDDSDKPFIDIFYTIVDAPHVGRSLLGDSTYEWATKDLEQGEHLLVMFGRGVSSFRGSGFVRGGIFDRFRMEQGLSTVMFTDRDYTRLNRPRAEGSPQFNESALFVVPAGKIDPGLSFDLIFLSSRFSGKGGFDRDFVNFTSSHRLPKSVYKLDGPDPEQAIWRAAWRQSKGRAAFLAFFLLGVTGVFAGRRWSTARMQRLERMHLFSMVFSFVVVGVILGVQPSVTQVLTLVDSVVNDWSWGLFLSEPLLVVFWIFIAIVTVIWGRGVFCGWVCPYGSLSELLFKLGAKFKVPHYELPDSIHKPLRFLRYVVLAVLVAAFLIEPAVGEMMAEVEPFKSTFYVPAWTRPLGFFVWWALLLVLSVFWWRPFCRYLCPLGAALAIPGSFRLSGPYRRDFCTKCKICTRTCEPRAIRDNGTIDPRECLSCMECEANYRDDQVCPPLVKIRRVAEKEARLKAEAQA